MRLITSPRPCQESHALLRSKPNFSTCAPNPIPSVFLRDKVLSVTPSPDSSSPSPVLQGLPLEHLHIFILIYMYFIYLYE